MYSPPPSRAFAPAEFSRPPITNVGSSPPAASTLATKLVVVVLPCVPAIAMPCFSRISSASITARGTIGIRLARAACTSGLSSDTAVETTTASAPVDVFSAMTLRDLRASCASRLVAALQPSPTR